MDDAQIKRKEKLIVHLSQGKETLKSIETKIRFLRLERMSKRFELGKDIWTGQDREEFENDLST